MFAFIYLQEFWSLGCFIAYYTLLVFLHLDRVLRPIPADPYWRHENLLFSEKDVMAHQGVLLPTNRSKVFIFDIPVILIHIDGLLHIWDVILLKEPCHYISVVPHFLHETDYSYLKGVWPEVFLSSIFWGPLNILNMICHHACCPERTFWDYDEKYLPPETWRYKIGIPLLLEPWRDRVGCDGEFSSSFWFKRRSDGSCSRKRSKLIYIIIIKDSLERWGFGVLGNFWNHH